MHRGGEFGEEAAVVVEDAGEAAGDVDGGGGIEVEDREGEWLEEGGVVEG